jgi:magnesium chelatase subunit D
MAYPLGAIVGLNSARRALLLLATDPLLKGVLISSKSGGGKSLLARAAREVFQSVANIDTPFVEVPVNTTPDMLLAGLDVERTLSKSSMVIETGLLARADGGLLYADGMNLMSDATISNIAAALESDLVVIEREGISARLPARFALLGTYDRTEGAVSAAISERLGLLIEADEELESKDREEMIRRVLSFEKDAKCFIEEYSAKTRGAIDAVKRARSLLPQVRILRDEIQSLSAIALRMGVKGNRADIFAVRAMRASAALEGRDRLKEEDLLAAIEFVLAPRAMSASAPHEHEQLENGKNEQDESERPSADTRGGEAPGTKNGYRNAAEFLTEPRDGAVPEIRASFKRNQASRPALGKRAESNNVRAGRYIGSMTSGSTDAPVAVDATLRAAAPFQKSRRAQSRSDNVGAIKISPRDLRYKRYRRRNGMLFVFVVDASGSMAANRMAQAKGALLRLLEKAYLHRDQVALISFQRSNARVLLEPTRSVARAKRIIESMPAGGTTPLAAGLMRGLETVRLARLHGAGNAMLILLTDGRANTALSKNVNEALDPMSVILEELREVGVALEKASVASIVVDTKLSFLSSGEARALADAIRADYIYLPRADGAGVFNAVSSVAAQLRR